MIKKTLQQAFDSWIKLQHQLHSSLKEWSMEFFPEINLKRRSTFRYSTGVISAHLSHVGPITRRKFKNSGLARSEYFTSLETIKDNNSHVMVVTTTPRGILHPVRKPKSISKGREAMSNLEGVRGKGLPISRFRCTLAKKVIDLPESKRPEEINKVGDPRYCKFHRILGHRQINDLS
ncbi:hypothetical protein H5410_002222 [Solanum commersonii]|uniref:Uncharacterized protein n=1 Tax=Solanum commersonii TaxID=4109 RepID=A0A9J6B1C8_SOLCO|nr:hypothetical protein H5410_002222 [Solanum commersonii]